MLMDHMNGTLLQVKQIQLLEMCFSESGLIKANPGVSRLKMLACSYVS